MVSDILKQNMSQLENTTPIFNKPLLHMTTLINKINYLSNKNPSNDDSCESSLCNLTEVKQNQNYLRRRDMTYDRCVSNVSGELFNEKGYIE